MLSVARLKRAVSSSLCVAAKGFQEMWVEQSCQSFIVFMLLGNNNYSLASGVALSGFVKARVAWPKL